MPIQRISMSPEQREWLLSVQEDHFADLKSKRIAPAALQKHFVAFANTDGGDLYVGVEDTDTKGPRIRGFDTPEEANALIQTFSEIAPTVDGADFEFLDFERGGLVLHVSVPKSPKVHYAADGECYIMRKYA